MPKTPLRVCSQPGCTKPHHSHGLCAPHARKRLHGLPKCEEQGCSAEAIKLGYCRRHEGRLLDQLPQGELDAILDDAAAHIVADPVTGCWLWTGSVDSEGYAHCKVGGKDWLVHRLMYLLLSRHEISLGKHFYPYACGLTVVPSRQWNGERPERLTRSGPAFRGRDRPSQTIR